MPPEPGAAPVSGAVGAANDPFFGMLSKKKEEEREGKNGEAYVFAGKPRPSLAVRTSAGKQLGGHRQGAHETNGILFHRSIRMTI